jgi:hypothetical protein
MKVNLQVVYLLPVFIAFTLTSARAQSITRIEQNDPSVTYSGNWYTNTSTANTGGLAALTNTRGARASLTFTGTGINWLGVSDGWGGLATVYVDGVMTLVNTYGNESRYQRSIFSARGLANGPHTISIEVMHERGAGTEGSWVWIDAFEIEGGKPIPGGITAPAGRVEDTDPSLVFSGRWYSKMDSQHSGGRAVLAMDPGFRVDLHFNGTGVSWIGYRDEWSGLARVYVDGEPKTTIDNYRSPAEARGVLYHIEGLSPGAHSLTIEVTGTRSASAKASWIWIDAFDVRQE